MQHAFARVGQAGHQGDRRPVVTQLAVRVVLDHPQAVGGGDVDDGLPAGPAHRPAGRVGEGRHQVQQGRPVLADRRPQRVGIQAVIVAGHGHDPRVGEPERLERGQVGGALHGHDAARIQQGGGDQGQRLLRAAGDQHVGRAGRYAAAGQPVGHLLPQPRIALGGRVLQVPRARRGRQGLAEGIAKPVEVEQFRRG